MKAVAGSMPQMSSPQVQLQAATEDYSHRAAMEVRGVGAGYSVEVVH